MPEEVEPTGTHHGTEEIAKEESPPVPLQADIESFEASPSPIHQGESTELRWKASGVAAEICPISRYTYFTDNDCQSVPVTGSLVFTMPDDLQPSFEPGFRLSVFGDEGTESQQAYVYVNLYCPIDWFFEPEQASGPLCPEESNSSWTAVQHFENGTMIWMESLERYIIFHGKSINQEPSDLQE
jgi:hypothetical protein